MEIHIAQFAVWYKTSRGDAETVAQITARSEFDLTEEDALAVTDRARAYLKAQLESKGFVAKAPTTEEIEGTKTYKKFLKKGGGTAVNYGGTYHARNEARHNERIGTFATGVTGMYLGSHAGAGDYGKVAHEVAGKEGRLSLNVITHFDYSVTEAGEIKSEGKVALAFVPRLRLWDDINSYLGQTTFNFHNNKKVGTRIYGGQELVYEGDEWVDVDLGDDGVFYFKNKPEQFKEAAFALLREYMDQVVARVETAKAKG